MTTEKLVADLRAAGHDPWDVEDQGRHVYSCPPDCPVCSTLIPCLFCGELLTEMELRHTRIRQDLADDEVPCQHRPAFRLMQGGRA